MRTEHTLSEPRKTLDDHDSLERMDSLGVLPAVEAFADQCRAGWATGLAASGLPDPAGLESVVILGMGGSGAAGDMLQAVLEPRFRLPVRVVKGYGPLPEWVGRNSLVFAVSYSGNTEETISTLNEAHERGARSVVVCSGGALAEIAQQHGMALVLVPAGLQPRAALGFLAMPLFGAVSALGLVANLEDDVDEACKVVEELAAGCNHLVPLDDNPAKDLALRLIGRVPFVYGGQGIGATAAYRFKCDLNEYGKTHAFYNYFPELNHNEVVGWSRPLPMARKDVVAVFVRDTDEHPRVARRFEVTRELIEDKLEEVVEVWPQGEGALARLLSLVFVTQMAAIYVGFGHRLDPGPVEILDRVKKELG